MGTLSAASDDGSGATACARTDQGKEQHAARARAAKARPGRGETCEVVIWDSIRDGLRQCAGHCMMICARLSIDRVGRSVGDGSGKRGWPVSELRRPGSTCVRRGERGQSVRRCFLARCPQARDRRMQADRRQGRKHGKAAMFAAVACSLVRTGVMRTIGWRLQRHTIRRADLDEGLALHLGRSSGDERHRRLQEQCRGADPKGPLDRNAPRVHLPSLPEAPDAPGTTA
jgi:hypothetical protein